MPPITMSESELAGLSAEEREALADDGAPAEVSALQKIAGEPATKSAASPTAAAADTSPSGDADADPDGISPDVIDDDDQTAAPFVPTYHAQVPENYDVTLAELVSNEDALATKFKDGDLTFEEYRTQANAVAAERTKLLTAHTKAEISAEMTEQSATQRWQWEIGRFMKEAVKADGIDYKANRLLNAALDVAVKDLAGDKANADKDGEWFLAEAHKMVKEQMGMNRPDGKPNLTVIPKDPVKAAVDERRRSIPAAPKTLSNIPAAAEADVGQDEFAALDRMAEGDVMEYERALARLTPDQAQRYLRVGGG